MSAASTEISKQPKVRLKFIDMARSVAILLMLEGHFVDDSLILEARDPDSFVYNAWFFMRNYTAPIFLTVTGLIFVYLLLKKREESVFKNIRIRKGLKRVIELFFWGFIVQYNAFHVLECIAFGIFTILLVYAIYKLVKYIPLWIYFFLAGTIIFALFPTVRDLPNGMAWPEHLWHLGYKNVSEDTYYIIQFPTVPFVGFTMYGAMIGALVHDFHDHIKKMLFPIIISLTGISFFFFSAEILGTMDVTLESIIPSIDFQIASLTRLYEKMGMVLIVLSILMFIDNKWGHKIKGDSLFLKIGQNTLTIYVLHMLLLYYLVHLFGLTPHFRHSLSPWLAAFGAVGFIAIFVILIKYLEPIKKGLWLIINLAQRIVNFVIEGIKQRVS